MLIPDVIQSQIRRALFSGLAALKDSLETRELSFAPAVSFRVDKRTGSVRPFDPQGSWRRCLLL